MCLLHTASNIRLNGDPLCGRYPYTLCDVRSFASGRTSIFVHMPNDISCDNDSRFIFVFVNSSAGISFCPTVPLYLIMSLLLTPCNVMKHLRLLLTVCAIDVVHPESRIHLCVFVEMFSVWFEYVVSC